MTVEARLAAEADRQRRAADAALDWQVSAREREEDRARDPTPWGCLGTAVGAGVLSYVILGLFAMLALTSVAGCGFGLLDSLLRVL